MDVLGRSGHVPGTDVVGKHSSCSSCSSTTTTEVRGVRVEPLGQSGGRDGHLRLGLGEDGGGVGEVGLSEPGVHSGAVAVGPEPAVGAREPGGVREGNAGGDGGGDGQHVVVVGDGG